MTIRLYMIPYGLNKIDIKVPQQNKLIPESTGLKMMLISSTEADFSSRNGNGLLKRMMEDASKHCQERQVGAGNLFSFDQVQFQLSKMQSFFTLCSAMCAKVSR